MGGGFVTLADNRWGTASYLLRCKVKQSIPDNSPDSKEPGGTGFPACAKNTLFFKVI